MGTITTTDGTEIFYKDWGSGQPIVFSHGWPLSADDWDTQMLFFLQHGYRVVAHDRRGHGRSTQTGDGHDMDHYADDLAALTAHLDLHDAVHVGHSTGGGEVAHYIGRHGEARVAKAVLISAVPPLMVQTEANPGGLPKSVFDGLQAQLAANRSEFYRALPSGPFYGFNRPGVEPSEAIIVNWWRQGMMGRREGPLRRHRRLLADRLHRGPQEDHRARPGDARRRRPDRALRRLGAAVGRARSERHPQDLRGLPARHADHAGRHHQRRPARLHPVLTDGGSDARTRPASHERDVGRAGLRISGCARRR
jgi:pimeloyl-ACP methyl ester carboxylesterase